MLLTYTALYVVVQYKINNSVCDQECCSSSPIKILLLLKSKVNYLANFLLFRGYVIRDIGYLQ